MADWTRFVGNRCFMRMSEGHCIALRREASGLQLCSVYERRPRICRELERGSPACAAERLRKPVTDRDDPNVGGSVV